ncbi:multidrug efflux protein [Pseudoruegeria aquimaris]|uniref:Multidrug efflux protein n=1 Tax=Pseudoruegeria aquimaris TaxID=393663 RepID=A0A1Y5T249_9RHOB|nr:MATE family efflux transporter [Pseudoruegeria aquimaris]SLN52077.1 multidrug efflux protein [Pseudoruegeria aquimaris]
MTLRAMMLHGIVVIDAYLVSALGEAALAAMGLASAIAGLLLGAQAAFANAGQILVAQAFGSGRALAQQTVFRTNLLISAGVCLLGLTIVSLVAGPVLRASGQSEAIQGAAQTYLTIFALVVIAEALGQSLSAHFTGCGRTRIPFYSYLLTLPVNVAVSYALIHGIGPLPALGLAGAAWGSAVAALLRAGYLAAFALGDLRRWPRGAGYEGGSLRRALTRNLAFSSPVAATFFSAQASASVCMLIYARYDLYQFAALTLILPWIHVAGTFGMSWAQATGVTVAQLLGQGIRGERLSAFLRVAFRGAMIAACLVATAYGVIVLSAGWIYGDLQPQTRAALLSFLPVLLLLPWPKNSNAICGNSLRAGGETVYVMALFLWSQWLFKVPLTALVVLVLQWPAGWALAILLGEELVKFAPFHLRLKRGRWRDPDRAGAG